MVHRRDFGISSFHNSHVFPAFPFLYSSINTPFLLSTSLKLIKQSKHKQIQYHKQLYASKMVDLDWKNKMISSDIPTNKSPRLSNKLNISIPPPKIHVTHLSTASDSSITAYEHYLRLQHLHNLWRNEFPSWINEPLIKPAFTALELTFRFISTVLSDFRPYVNKKEWKRKLESLASSEIEIIALLCEEGEEDLTTRGTIPIVDLTMEEGVLSRENSSAEVWKMIDNDTVVVSQISEESLLPKIATWHELESVVKKIHYSIEFHMQGCPYTLGLGEPNLSGKPSLNYDLICKPFEIHALRNCSNERNSENGTLYVTHQILESWARVARGILERIISDIDSENYEKASSMCWILEKVWSVMSRIEDLHLLMDPDDFLRLKHQLAIKASSESELFCFRSRELVEITRCCKDLRHKLPGILGVEVDPTGGPRIQNAAMELYEIRKDEEFAKVHLLQAMQGVEIAVKRFYFGYERVLEVVMGSLEAKSGCGGVLSRIFLEPVYYPSLDAAKTFLGERWSHELGK